VDDGTNNKEDTVDKVTILSDGYADWAKVREELDQLYRKIGISAVAAAVRYQGEARTAAPTRDDDQVWTDSAA
jgi:hypothetical protein